MAFIHVRPPPSPGQLSRWNCLRFRQVFDKIQQWPHTIKGHHQIRTQNSFPFPAKELKSTHFYQGLSGCPGCWRELKAGDSSTVTLCRWVINRNSSKYPPLCILQSRTSPFRWTSHAHWLTDMAPPETEAPSGNRCSLTHLKGIFLHWHGAPWNRGTIWQQMLTDSLNRYFPSLTWRPLKQYQIKWVKFFQHTFQIELVCVDSCTRTFPENLDNQYWPISATPNFSRVLQNQFLNLSHVEQLSSAQTKTESNIYVTLMSELLRTFSFIYMICPVIIHMA